MKNYKTSAFSLIELLAVIAIISVLAALATGPFSGTARSLQMANAAESLAASMNLARTEAVARNAVTELRFFEDGSVQILLLPENAELLPLTKRTRLPQGIVLASEAKFSGIMNLPLETVPADQPGAGMKFRAIRFGTRGEPRDTAGNVLKDDRNFLTVVVEQNYRPGVDLPRNWITLCLDERTGAVRRFQP